MHPMYLDQKHLETLNSTPFLSNQVLNVNYSYRSFQETITNDDDDQHSDISENEDNSDSDRDSNE